jgi:hypothetical protein
MSKPQPERMEKLLQNSAILPAEAYEKEVFYVAFYSPPQKQNGDRLLFQGVIKKVACPHYHFVSIIRAGG